MLMHFLKVCDIESIDVKFQTILILKCKREIIIKI